MSFRDTIVWYTLDNLHGDSWCNLTAEFVDAEGEFDKYDDPAEAIELGQQLWQRGERNHVVTEHVVKRDGVERTYNYWEA